MAHSFNLQASVTNRKSSFWHSQVAACRPICLTRSHDSFLIPWSFRWQDYIFTWAHCHWPRWGPHFQAVLQLQGPVARAQVFSDVMPVQAQKLLASANFTQGSLLGASMNLNFVVFPSWDFQGSHSQSHLHTSLSDPPFRSPVPPRFPVPGTNCLLKLRHRSLIYTIRKRGHSIWGVIHFQSLGRGWLGGRGCQASSGLPRVSGKDTLIKCMAEPRVPECSPITSQLDR